MIERAREEIKKKFPVRVYMCVCVFFYTIVGEEGRNKSRRIDGKVGIGKNRSEKWKSRERERERELFLDILSVIKYIKKKEIRSRIASILCVSRFSRIL